MSKRHFNMAPASSDRRIAERAAQMSDCYLVNVARELGIGFGRMKRIAAEFGLVFRQRPFTGESHKPARSPLEAGRVVMINGLAVKKCSGCGEVKGVEFYRRDPTKRSDCQSRCKECRRLSSKITTGGAV